MRWMRPGQEWRRRGDGNGYSLTHFLCAIYDIIHTQHTAHHIAQITAQIFNSLWVETLSHLVKCIKPAIWVVCLSTIKLGASCVRRNHHPMAIEHGRTEKLTSEMMKKKLFPKLNHCCTLSFLPVSAVDSPRMLTVCVCARSCVCAERRIRLCESDRKCCAAPNEWWLMAAANT